MEAFNAQLKVYLLDYFDWELKCYAFDAHLSDDVTSNTSRKNLTLDCTDHQSNFWKLADMSIRDTV